MIYHVSVNGCDTAAGTKEAPFRTISHAAKLACPGDTVQVHEGTYREWVDPQNSASSETDRIIYEAAPGEHPIIKGSEIVTDWKKVKGTIWKKSLPNTMFGEWNPYLQRVEGDWLRNPKEYDVHLGDVYINGVSMYEASSLEDLYQADIRLSGFQISPFPEVEPIRNPEQTIYRWFAKVDKENTTLFCNFHSLDPNKELIEINVRKCCFYPRKPGINYITVRGFEIAHAACPFTPPTSDQIGMVGPHWSLGWIIEDNHLHDAKCSALSIGKEASTGDNECFHFHKKHSYYYQVQAVFRALQAGWSKETIGSHIIRNNVIHDCGQNGIVGHMGCVFSRIEHNHIYNIGVKHEFEGAEIAGIKLHAAIDVIIENNNIHDCTRGTWLDWQAQGTRVTRNLFYHNDRSDLMLEVTHGPCLIDHNLFLSAHAFENLAQGTAYVHNIIAGNVKSNKVLERDTPYHFPHTTQIAGITKVLGGDDRVLNNMILGAFRQETTQFRPMCTWYNEFETPENYYAKTSKGIDIQPLQPVWIDGNAYGGYASAFRAEKNPIRADEMAVLLDVRNGEWTLLLDIPDTVADACCEPVTTERLGTPIFTEEPYENPDGTPIDLLCDFFGQNRDASVIPGPFAKLETGKQQIVIWKFLH